VKKQCEHRECRAARVAIFSKEVESLECASPDCRVQAAAILLDKSDILYLCYFHTWLVLNEKVNEAKAELVLENLPAPRGEHEKGS
jgi:hypothetical protein